MSGAPRVSIVVAAYNAAATLLETLATVEAQTFDDFELIAVDDGSTDDTAALLASEAARLPWLRVVRQQNAGVSSARMRGIAMARSAWIAFLDADDLWMPDKLAAQMALLRRNERAAFVYTDMIDFSDEGDARQTLFEQKKPARGRVAEALFRHNFILTSTVLVRRDAVLDAGGFDASMKVNEDFDLWLRLAMRHEFDYVDRVLVRRRILGGSLTRANQMACYFADLGIIDRWVRERPDLFAPDSRTVKRRRALILSRIGYQHLADRDFARARCRYGEAVRDGQRDPTTLLRLAAASLPWLAHSFWTLKGVLRRR